MLFLTSMDTLMDGKEEYILCKLTREFSILTSFIDKMSRSLAWYKEARKQLLFLYL